MKHQIVTGVLIAAATLATTVMARNYIAERPAFLTSCVQAEADFNSCYANNFQMSLRQWKSGVPGLKSLGPIDPLMFKRISITQNARNPLIQLNANLLKVQMGGMSETLVTEANLDLQKSVVHLKMVIPKITIHSDYTATGHIFNLALDTKGEIKLALENIETSIAAHLKISKEDGLTFTDVDKFRLEITNIKGLQIYMSNLFNGRKELEESTNTLINQNWREFYEVLSPAITEAFEAVMGNWVKKIFAFVPASYFVADL